MNTSEKIKLIERHRSNAATLLLAIVCAALSLSFSAPVFSQPIISSTAFPNGRVGSSYSFALQATGGLPPYTWTATGLPIGLSIAPSTGVVSGVPTAPTSQGWKPIAGDITLTPRMEHTAVWTGSRMLVWGGVPSTGGFVLANGGSYDPESNSWSSINGFGFIHVGRRLHTAIWTGSHMIVWGGWGGSSVTNTGASYNPATNTWTATSTLGAPDARAVHTAIWTGSRMIVWGGIQGTTLYQSGGIYDPVSDTWATISQVGAPSPRYYHTATWTGSKMLVWGGQLSYVGGLPSQTGAAYDPVTNSWATITTIGAPTARYAHSAVWDGSSMIVFGGQNQGTPNGPTNTGGKYDPVANAWTATSTTGVGSARFHTAVWTGDRMIVGSGHDGYGIVGDGSVYDPVTDRWQTVTGQGAPPQTTEGTAVWTGTRMLKWGGRSNNGTVSTGGSYINQSPHYIRITVTDQASAMTSKLVPLTVFEELVLALPTSALPIGVIGVPYSNQLMFQGGDSANYSFLVSPSLPSGLSLDSQGRIVGIPLVDSDASYTFVLSDGFVPSVFVTGRLRTVAPLSIQPTSLPRFRLANPFSAQFQATGGSGGYLWSASGLPTGASMGTLSGLLSGTLSVPTPPTSNVVKELPLAYATQGRIHASVVWSGTGMIVWGGLDGFSQTVGTGAMLDQNLSTWTMISNLNAPTPRSRHSAVWTGSRMIVWGGAGQLTSLLNDGGSYDPATDSWIPISTVGAPSPRAGHHAIWTGSRMIVGGGEELTPGIGSLHSYDPVLDTWSALSTVNAPVWNSESTAVWTGSRILIWGGHTSNSGGMYDLVSNTWTALSNVAMPLGRYKHHAVWTGGRMIVWGGFQTSTDTVPILIGSSFDPIANAWTPIASHVFGASSGNSVSAWTGTKMVVWTGVSDHYGVPTDFAYDPALNAWQNLNVVGHVRPNPENRAVWTGTKLLRWGGRSDMPHGGSVLELDAPHHISIRVSDSTILTNTFAVPFSVGYSRKDLNQDNQIDVVDVQICVNLILALVQPTYPGMGDTNSDLSVDVVDIQAIVNCILNQTNCD